MIEERKNNSMTQETGQTSVEALLADAASGVAGAAEQFFRVLLTSDVYLPLKTSVSHTDFPRLGSGDAILNNCLTVRHDGKTVLPIFTQEEFVDVWAERAVPAGMFAFKGLLWLIPEDLWLYLNPCQDCGKELSPWECLRLREGPEAIADILHDLGETGDAFDVEVVRDTELFKELKASIIEVLEAYSAVAEARMIGTRDDDDGTLVPLLGLTLTATEPTKLKQLRLELHETASLMLPRGIALTIADDLADINSLYHQLFADMVPFYIRQRAWPETEPSPEEV